MGGYPALQIRPPESPLESFAKVQQIKTQQQAQQLQGLQIQQEQQQIKDREAMTQAMLNWDGKDVNQIPMLALRAGGSSAAAFGIQNQILGVRQKSSEIAKNDALTAQDNAKTLQDQNDQLRGRVQSIISAPAEQKQSLWESEVAKEEKAGTIQPGSISHQYPGDTEATVFANHFALGSQLAKEAQEREKLKLDAWKPSGGQLINVVDGSKIGGLTNIPGLNAGIDERWQVMHPGEKAPDTFHLPSNATPEDFVRIDKLLEGTERAGQTKAQQATTDAMRQQMFEMQRDKTDLQAVIGQDKNGRAVMVPMGQAQQLGLQNTMKAPEDTVNKALAARHWLQLANTQADPKAKPEEMGINQLVDELDSEGKLGAVASRWNEFMTGKVGAGDPEISALRAKMGLSTTLLMQAHVGSRGSAQMLEHFEDLANQKKLDGPTLKAALGAEVNYVQDRAMDPNPPNYGKAPTQKTTTPTKPSGATHTGIGSIDKKKHWLDASGKDLGPAE